MLHLVMYKRRSACSGSESPGGFILLPQSHTLLSEDVMLDDSWISAWGEQRKALNVTFNRIILLLLPITRLLALNKSLSEQVIYETWLYFKARETECLLQAPSG